MVNCIIYYSTGAILDCIVSVGLVLGNGGPHYISKSGNGTVLD